MSLHFFFAAIAFDIVTPRSAGLSATRRLAWTKLGVRETPPDLGGFEKTAESPLFETPPK